MSSILDALNKVEEEQEQIRAQEAMRPEDIDSSDAVDDLIGGGTSPRSFSLPLMIGGGFLALTVLVGVVAYVVASVMKPSPISSPSTVIAAIPAPPVPVVETIPAPIIPEPAPIIEPSPSPAPVAINTAPPEPIATAPEKTPVAPAVPLEKTPDPLPPLSSDVLDKKGPLDFTPEPAPVKPMPPPAPVIHAPAQVVTPPQKDDTPIHLYEPFTAGVQLKYGLDTFKINMVSPKSARYPYGSAIINREKVFEGSAISGSQIILYAVEKNGVALEISRTGKLYYKSFR